MLSFLLGTKIEHEAAEISLSFELELAMRGRRPIQCYGNGAVKQWWHLACTLNVGCTIPGKDLNFSEDV